MGDSNPIAPPEDQESISKELRKIQFPWKVHSILAESEKDYPFPDNTNAPISWMPDGRSFRVNDRHAFAEKIMPKYFFTCNYKTFQRNLTLWGFFTTRGVVQHPLFIRGKPELCHLMERTKAKHNSNNNNNNNNNNNSNNASNGCSNDSGPKVQQPQHPGNEPDASRSSMPVSFSATTGGPNPKHPPLEKVSSHAPSVNQFPGKLHNILQDVEAEYPDPSVAPISWLPNGLAFKVHDRQKFTEEIMPKYFSTNNYKTFQRNLTLWGYHTENKGPRRGVVHHPLFVRGKFELCHLMERTKVRYGPSGSEKTHALPPSETGSAVNRRRSKKIKKLVSYMAAVEEQKQHQQQTSLVAPPESSLPASIQTEAPRMAAAAAQAAPAFPAAAMESSLEATFRKRFLQSQQASAAVGIDTEPSSIEAMFQKHLLRTSRVAYHPTAQPQTAAVAQQQLLQQQQQQSRVVNAAHFLEAKILQQQQQQQQQQRLVLNQAGGMGWNNHLSLAENPSSPFLAAPMGVPAVSNHLGVPFASAVLQRVRSLAASHPLGATTNYPQPGHQPPSAGRNLIEE